MPFESPIAWFSSPASTALPAALMLVALATVARAEPASAASVHDFQVRAMDGRDVPLSEYAGTLLLVVNTASRCGFTSQYEGLENLVQRYRARGFEVLAFPANDFLGQEPGTDAEIREFCTLKYAVTFPVFSKLRVKGRRMHPLYAHLTRDSARPGAVGWNFTKFLVDQQGRVVDRFDSRTDPTDARVIRAIEARLPAQ